VCPLFATCKRGPFFVKRSKWEEGKRGKGEKEKRGKEEDAKK
jgi:hypothetical protein